MMIELQDRDDADLRGLRRVHDAEGPRALYQHIENAKIPSTQAVEDLAIAFYTECNRRWPGTY